MPSQKKKKKTPTEFLKLNLMIRFVETKVDLFLIL